MRKEVYLERQKKDSAGKVRTKQKMLRSQRQDLKQNKGKSKKDKGGLLDLILEKNQKDILSKIPFPIIDS